MSNSKKILVTSFTRETFIVRHGGQAGAVKAFCAGCEAETELLDSSLAATAYRIGIRAIVRRVETGEIHSEETANGQLLVCRRSLENFCQ